MTGLGLKPASPETHERFISTQTLIKKEEGYVLGMQPPRATKLGHCSCPVQGTGVQQSTLSELLIQASNSVL